MVSLSWNLIHRLIWIFRIQWWWSLFLISNGNTFFQQICFKKSKIVSLSWNLVLILILSTWRIHWWYPFFLFIFPKVSFFGQICSKKIKIVCWGWIWEPRLIWMYRIWWWFSSFLDGKYLFWVNFIQNFKISSLTWNLVPKLFHFSCFRPFFASLFENIHLAFWCHLINLQAVYSQRLEASGFSCFHLKSGLTVLGTKIPRFSPAGSFFSVFLMKCFFKVLFFRETSLTCIEKWCNTLFNIIWCLSITSLNRRFYRK